MPKSSSKPASKPASLSNIPANSVTLPGSVEGTIYPNNASGNAVFSEMAFRQFNPAYAHIGVAFSGGGSRSMAASMGQMRALRQESFYNTIGAISCVSGGGWFGTPFTFADSSMYTDDQLLGTQIPPNLLTKPGLQKLNSGNICGALPLMGYTEVIATLTWMYYYDSIPLQYLWSRMLSVFMLYPYNIGDTSTFFTLNNATLNRLLSQNASLAANNFYLQRANRPFFISGGTQIYPNGANQVLRHMEYSAMYAGTPQNCGPIGPNGTHYGEGYVDNILFATTNPSSPSSNQVTADLTNINGTLYPFLLTDQMGSSSSAPGADINFFTDTEDWFPEFNYWSPKYAGTESAEMYSFTDGGNLENTGIVPLLRRQYPIIFAFVNSELPLGGTGSGYVDGVDAQ